MKQTLTAMHYKHTKTSSFHFYCPLCVAEGEKKGLESRKQENSIEQQRIYHRQHSNHLYAYPGSDRAWCHICHPSAGDILTRNVRGKQRFPPAMSQERKRQMSKHAYHLKVGKVFINCEDCY